LAIFANPGNMGFEDPMPTRNISLTDHLDRLVEAEVGSGRYGNASEVVREGLRLIERRKQEERAKLKWLRGAVREGLDQIDRGEGVEFGSIGDLDRHIDQIGKEASAELAGKGERA
jgi:antitoxin ParD1/3/4